MGILAVTVKTAFVPSKTEAGQRSAVIYSVLGSSRRLGINPADIRFPRHSN